MSGRGEGSGGGIHAWLRGALVVVVIAAALGVFSSRSGLSRPRLGALNIAGLAVMGVGALLAILGPTLAQRARDGARGATATALRLAGVLACFAGAIMVFL